MLTIHKLRLLSILSISILAFSCDSFEYGNDGSNLFQPGDVVGYVDISSRDMEDSTWQYWDITSTPVRTLTGHYNDYHAITLIKFKGLSTLADSLSLEILSATLEISPYNMAGDAAADSVALSLHVLSTDWNENELSDLDISDLTYDLDPIGSFNVGWRNSDSTSQRLSFVIPLPLLDAWIDGTDSIGLAVVTEPDAQFMIEIPTTAAETDARNDRTILSVIFVDGEDTTTNHYRPSAEGYVLDDDNILDPGYIVIGGGVAYRGFLYINPVQLANIPSEAVVAQAELYMVIDLNSSVLAESHAAQQLYPSVQFLYFNLVDSLDAIGNIVALDSTTEIRRVIPTESDSFIVDLAPLVQKWITEEKENLGIAIRFSGESSHSYRLHIYGQDWTGDEALKPRMDIYYSNPQIERK